MKNIVLAIHGVGETEKGEILHGLAQGLELDKLDIHESVINTSSYLEGSNEEQNLKIVEINWSQLMKPHPNLYGMIRHIAFLVNAMLSFAVDTYGKYFPTIQLGGKNVNLATISRAVLESLALGASFMPIIATLALDVSTTYHDQQYDTTKHISGLLFIIAICLVYLFLTIKGRKYSVYYNFGWVILPVYLWLLYVSFPICNTTIIYFIFHCLFMCPI